MNPWLLSIVLLSSRILLVGSLPLLLSKLRARKMAEETPLPSYGEPGTEHQSKPLCGPVPFPDFSCEEVTTCIPVVANYKGNENDGGLHEPYETTCMIIEPINPAQRMDGGWLNYEAFLRNNIGITSSTMAVYVNGTAPPVIEEVPNVDLESCKEIANCKLHKW